MIRLITISCQRTSYMKKFVPLNMLITRVVKVILIDFDKFSKCGWTKQVLIETYSNGKTM